jgi:hypothetical protein
MDNLNKKLSDEAQNQPSCLGAVMRSCYFCQFFQHEEIGDSDFGGVYAENPSCSKYFDTDEETEEDIPNFDRTIERDCCKLDFWRVVEVDKDLSEKLAIEQDKNEGSFSETYELFKVRYNYA